MALDKTHPHYPNYDFLQLEEINQVIYNYTKLGHKSTSYISTEEITDKYSSLGNHGSITSSFKYLRYNFTMVSCSIEGTVYTWKFDVHNMLWNGKWHIENLDGSAYTGTYSVRNDDVASNGMRGITLTLIGQNLKKFKLCLELNSADVNCVISTSPVVFSGSYNYSHQYDEERTENAYLIYGDTKLPVTDAKVKLVPLMSNGNVVDESNKSGYLSTATGRHIGKGYYAINYSSVPCGGTYRARLEAYINDQLVATQPVVVTKIQNYERVIEVEPTTTVKTYDPERKVILPTGGFKMYKGEIKKFDIQIQSINKYGKVVDKAGVDVVNVFHTKRIHKDPTSKVSSNKTITDKLTFKTDENGKCTIKLSSREFYGDTSTLVISLPNNGKFKSMTSDKITVTHEWFKADSWGELKNECQREWGADAIVLKNKTFKRTTQIQRIYLNRANSCKQYILGEKGKGWATLDNNNFRHTFELPSHINNGMVNSLIIEGIKITNANGVIEQGENTYFVANKCVFSGNKNTTDNYEGGTVYQKGTRCVSIIKSCFFEDNYGNQIVGRGVVEFDNNLFKVTDLKYTVQPQPLVLNMYSGKGTLTNNFFYVNTSLKYDGKGKPYVTMSKTNKSYAKVTVWVGKTATVNGKNRHQLNRVNSFNFFDKPYNNRAYIFSAYYYPHGGVNAFIVASAPNSRIDRASGHAVYGIDWAWRDGYTLVRESSKDYNTRNPYLTYKNGKMIENARIKVPSSGGSI